MYVYFIPGHHTETTSLHRELQFIEIRPLLIYGMLPGNVERLQTSYQSDLPTYLARQRFNKLTWPPHRYEGTVSISLVSHRITSHGKFLLTTRFCIYYVSQVIV